MSYHYKMAEAKTKDARDYALPWAEALMLAQAHAMLALVDELRASREEPAFDAQDIASQMFIAYNEHGPNPWRTFDGRDVPVWPNLTDEVRAKWVAAAERAIEAMKTKI